MKPMDKMSMQTRRRLRRALALMLSVLLVAGVGLSYSPDRVLKAEELATTASVPDNDEPKEAKAEPEPEPEPKPEPAPAPKEEPPAKQEAPEPEKVTVQEETPATNDGGKASADKSGSADEPSAAVTEEELVLDTGTKEETVEETKEEKKEETWTVTFYNRDAEVHKKVKVVKGEAIGKDMPAVLAREDYSSYWALGDIVQGGQGKEIRVTGQRISSSYKPKADTVVVPDYESVNHTVTFYDSEGGSVIKDGTRTVGPDTNYCLNDIPAVPDVDGFRGKWVYSGGNFSNSVKITRDTDVWASYDQNVFRVTFNVDGKKYETDKYFEGDKLKLPTAPTSEGKEFSGWFDGNTEYKGGEAVTSNLTLEARFTEKFRVSFVIVDDEGKTETLSQYFKEAGDTIGTLPQAPFVAGKVFEKWVDQDTGETISAKTVVNGNTTAVATFSEVGSYNIKAEYYYLSDSGEEVIFSTDLLQVETSALPYTITAPATIQTDGSKVKGAPVYYAETPSVTVKKDDFSGNSATVRVKYVKFTAVYDIVYLLKDLTGNGYSEIERISGVQGVLNSYVTPTVKAYDYYALDRAETAQLTKASGQELKVYYKRKNVQLSFETNGGSYVGAITAPYGSAVALPATNPEREGYKFNGWYSDEALTKKVTGKVTLNGNTTLYAGWTGDTVNYTVVYMFEKYNDTGTSAAYVYDNSRTATAAAGTTVTASSAAEINRTGWEKDTTKNASSSVVVEADGSSVLKVYYKLKEYTFEFNAGTYSSGFSSKSVTATLTDKGVSGTGTLKYTMKVKLGQDISAEWPGNATGTYSGGKTVYFNGWKPSNQNTRYVTKRTTVTEDMIPTSGTSLTYTAQWTGSASTYTVNYWLQNANDDDYTKSEVYSQTYTSSSGNLSAKDISGYTYDHGNSGASNTTKYDFYYNRDKYKIDYYYGSDLLKTIDNVKFDANINKSGFNWTPTAEQCDVDNDFSFAGWYDNSTCQGEPYDFTTMPASNLVLYAKWTAPTYTVSFVNADDSSPVADSQTVDKYKKATKPANPTRSGYSFDGWYASADGNDLFDWNKQITADTTAYARWAKKNLSYIVHYVDEEGNPVASDKEVSNPNLAAGQDITEMAIAVAGYRPNESSLTFTLAEEENSVTFTYSEKAETTGYTVRYLINNEDFSGDIPVAAEKTVNDVPGDTSSVVEMAKAVNYKALYSAHPELEGIEFYPDSVEKTLVLTSDAAQNILTFKYSSFMHADVKLHFVDMAGNKIAADDVQKLKVGRTFTLGRTAIDGWELKKAVTGTSLDGAEAGTEYKITEKTAESGLEFTLFYQKKATITALNASKQYDGKVLKLPADQVRVEGLLEGHTLGSVAFDYDGADAEDGRIEAGIVTVTPKDAVINGAPTADYYSFRYISGTLEVRKINVTIRIEPDRWTGAAYTGDTYMAGFTNPSKDKSDYVIISNESYSKAHLEDIWNVIKSKTDHDGSAAGLQYYGISKKDAGDYTYNIDVTLADLPSDENYSVGLYVRPGRLQILPKEATVTTESAAKEYDGTPLTQKAASITGLVKADEGKVKVTGTGSQTEPGTSTNDYSIDWGDVKAGNYNIVNETRGTLTVTARSLILTAASASKTYDGKALTDAGVTVDGLPKGFTIDATASGSQTDAGTSANKVNEGWVIKDASGADVTKKFTVSETVDGTLTVNKAPATITTGSSSKAYDGKALTNAEAGITGLVKGETAKVTATGSQTEVGSSSNAYSIKWDSAKAINYDVTENLGTLTVTDSDAELVLTASSAGKTYDGKKLTSPEVIASGLPEGFTVEATASGSIVDAGSAENVVNDGYIIRNAAGADKTSNFKNIQTVNGTLTVNPKDLTVTTGSDSKAYDGTALTNAEAKAEGFVDGETAEVKATGSQTETGSAANSYSIDWGTAKAGNYKVIENLGTLTVTDNNAAIVLTAASAGKTYDGKELKDASVTASGLPKGFTISATATGSQTDAGSSPNAVSDGYKILNASGADKTANFTNVTKADGTLTVNKAELTVTTGSGSKEYDGKALTNAEAKLEGLVNKETATVKATGSQTETGTGDNTYSIDWGTAKAGNYKIIENLGTLSVTENNTEVTLTAGSGSKTYDGAELTNAEVKAEGLPEGFTVVASASGSIRDAGTVSNMVNGDYMIKNSAGEDRTACFANVKTVEGTLTVEPKEAVITTGSDSKAYDGAALRNPEAAIDGLVSGETATVTANGEITELGSTENSYLITWNTAKSGNYKVTDKLGTLTITENKAEVTLTAPSASKTYDGTKLTADGSGDNKVTAGGLPEGFTLEATASGSQTDAGSSDNVVNDGFVIKNIEGKDKTSNFTNVKKVNGTLTVIPRALTVTTGSSGRAYDGTALTNDEVTAEGLVDGETIGLEATGSITETGSTENTCKITWAGSGNSYTAKEGNYTLTENLGTLTVTDSNVDVTLTAGSASKTYDGTALTNSEVTATGLPEGFTLEATASGSQTDAGTGVNKVDDGYVIRNAKGEDRTANFKKIAKVDGTLTVNPKPVTITTGSDSKAYDGTALTNADVSIDGIVAGETYGLNATGTITEIGSEENSFEMTWAGKGNSYTAKESNYTVTADPGTLTVTTNGAAITLTAASGNKIYDGKALTNEAVTANGLPDGFTLEAKAKGKQTEVGSSANEVVRGYVIKNAAGENKTANFTNISTVDGLLTVEPRTVTITTGSADKEYDGKALTKDEASIDGLADGDRASVKATGTQTEVGSGSNTYEINWGLFTKAENYTIAEKLGTLNVKENTSEVTLTAASSSKPYDGKELSDESVTAEGLPDGFTISATASGGQTEAGTSANVVNDGFVIRNSDGADRTANFKNVKKADGKLTVEKRNVTLTSATDEKNYDGIALVNSNVTIGGDGFAEGEGAVFNVTGIQKDAGSSANTFTYTLDAGTDVKNYTITTEEGTLTVKPAEEKVRVTVTEHSAKEKYDGSVKTVNGYDINIDNELYPKDSFTFSGNDSASGTDAGVYPMEIKAEDFTNNSENFPDVEFVINDGQLEITKRSVILTSASAESEYSGLAIFNHLVSIFGDGFASGEGASYEVTGSQKVVGVSDNLFTYLLNEGTKESNYNIITEFGKLIIKNRPDDAKYEVTVKAASGEETYDGKEHSVSGFVGGSDGDSIAVTAGGNSYTVSGLSASATATDAGTYPVTITGTPKVTDEDGSDVTDQFIVSYTPGSLVINKRDVTLTSGSSTREYNGKALTNNDVDVSGDGFARGEGATYSVTGSRTVVGSSENTFTYQLKDNTKADNYRISVVPGTLTVTNRDAKYDITVEALSAEYKYDGSKKTVEGFKTLEFSQDGNTYTVEGLSASVSAEDAGTYASVVTGTPVVKDEKGNVVTDQFAVRTQPGSLVISKRDITLTSRSAEREYNGKALTSNNVDVSGDGFAEGEGASYDVTGSRTLVGSSENSFTYMLDEGTNADNYNIRIVPGTLTVTSRNAKYEITVEASSAADKYDGSEKSVEGFKTLEFNVDGNTYTVEGLNAGASAKNAGTYASVVTGTPAVKDAKGRDVTDQFAVHTKPGSLEISKRDVTMTSGSAEREYNGKPLTNNDVEVTGDGFVKGEGADYEVTGSQKVVGVSDNRFTYKLKAGTNADNYNIRTEFGQLAVISRADDAKYEVTVTAASGDALYDGKEHSVSGFVGGAEDGSIPVKAGGNNYTVSGLSASAAATDAGTYPVTIAGSPKVTDEDGNVVTDQFIVRYAAGSLVIGKRSVTMTSGTATREYNGKALTNDEVTVSGDGFAEGEGATYNVTGSRTLVGSSENSFTYQLNGGAKAENYNITAVPGTLTVTNRNAKYDITVEAVSAEAKYDGKEKSAEGLKTLNFDVDGNKYTVEGLTAGVTATNAGTYASVVTGTPVVKDEKGNAVTDQFAVNTKAGSLVINKRNVTLTSGTSEAEYDGNPLTNGDVEVSGDGFAEGEGASYSVTGIRKLAGSIENAFTYLLNEGTDADNYNITTKFGTLTIKNRPADARYEVTVKAASGNALYDGKEHSVSGFTGSTEDGSVAVTAGGHNYTVSGIKASAAATDAGTYESAVTGTPKVTDEDGDDVTDQFIVKLEPGSLEIGKRTVTMTSGSAESEYNGKALTNDEVTVTGDGFAEGEGASYDVTGSQKVVGVSENAFTYKLNEGTNADNYIITPEFGQLVVNNRAENAKYEVTVKAASASALYDGKEHSVSGFAGGADDGSIAVTAGGNSYTVSGLSASAAATDAGTYTAAVTGTPKVTDEDGSDVTSQFIVKYEPGSLVIGKRTVTMTSGSAESEYNGKALTNDEVTVTGDGFVNGEGATYSVTGSRTLVGSSENSFTYKLNEGTKADNYNISAVPGTLTVTNRNAKYEIIVEASGAEYMYDGKEKTAEGFKTLKFNEEGSTYTVEGLSAKVSATDAGTYTSAVTGTPVVKDEKGNDVTDQFKIRTQSGSLVIGKRAVKMTSGTSEREYNGKALTNDEVTVTGDGFVKGEGATYSVTGSRTLVGSSENSFTYKLNEGTKADNYTINAVPGMLTVLSRNAKYEITVQASSAEHKYDGSEKTVEGFDTLEFSENGNSYTVEGLSAGVTATDAGTYTSAVTGTPVVKDEKGNDVTDQFAVHTQPGSLVIGKRDVTMTSGSSEREYNGKALTNDEVTVTGDGFADGEGATYNVTGSRTLVGMSENTFSYSLNSGTKASNYNINTVAGQLAVTSRGAKYSITLRPKSLTAKYDGTDKSVSGFETLSFNVDDSRYTVKDVETGASARNAGKYPANVTGTPTVYDAEGNNVTDQFKVTSVPGMLNIEQRNVIMTSASNGKIYDGTALTDDTVTVTGDGFAEGEGAVYNVTGSQKIAGASKNFFTYQLNEGTSAENYQITTVFGTLNITNRSGDARYEVTVTAASESALYDGEEHSVSGFVGGTEDGSVAVTAGGHNYTVSGLSASAAATGAGTYESAITGTPKVTDEDGNNVTAQFIVRLVPGSLSIGKRSVTLTSGSDSREYNGKPLRNDEVTVSGDGFAKGEGATYEVSGIRTLTGISENTFSYSLNEGTDAANYDINTVFGQLTVTSRNAKYGIVLRPKSLTAKYDGKEKSVSGFESLDFTVDDNVYTVKNVKAEYAAVNAGTYPVNVKGDAKVFDAAGNDVTDQFEITSEPGTLTIEKRTVVMTSADATKQYDGKELIKDTVTVSGDGFAKGEGATYNVTGRRLLPGSEKNSFTYTLNAGTLAGNYSISTKPGTLTVTNRDAKYEIMLQASDAEYMYDGTEKSAEGLKTLSFNVDGNSYTVDGMTAGVTARDAGEYISVVTGTPVVKDKSGNDVSEQFAVTTKPGKLVITPRKVIMTSGSATHAYNGKPLANGEVTVTGDGFAEGEGATYDVTGSRTIVGVSDNLFDYKLNDGTLAGNYDISKVYGKLNVTNRDAKYVLTLTPNGGSAMYDGEEHGVSGFVNTTAVVDGEKYEIGGLVAGVTGTDAGTYSVRVTGTPAVTDSKGNDVTEQFSVVSNEASFTITPRSVLLRSKDESREYDGTPLTGSGEFTVEGDGFVDGEGVIVTPTASRTLVGATENTFDWAFREGTSAGNYEITVEYGLLSVTNRDARYEITMTAKSDTVEYDGKEHSVSGFEENDFDVEGGKYTVDGVDAGAKGTDAGVYSTDITGTAHVKDAADNDVTDQFAVSYRNGSLTITSMAEPDEGAEGAAGGGKAAKDKSKAGKKGNGAGGDNAGNGGNAADDNGSSLSIETIEDSVPVAAAPSGYWALLNLIMMFINVIGGMYMLFKSFRKKDDDPNDPYRAAAYEESDSRQSRVGLVPVIIALLLAVVSVVVFILTEDLSNTMALFDKYTILMAVILIIAIATIIMGKRRSGNNENTDDLYGQA